MIGRKEKAKTRHTTPKNARIANVVNLSLVFAMSSTDDLTDETLALAQLISPAVSSSTTGAGAADLEPNHEDAAGAGTLVDSGGV
jgi:hypothetical protein